MTNVPGSMTSVSFDDIGRLPTGGDNAAIATRILEAGTQFAFRAGVHTLSHSMLEGHRFAVEPIAEGERLLSWGLPFGTALRAIEPGEYLCNAGILEALRIRRLDFSPPVRPNFRDAIAPCEFDAATFRPGRQVALHERCGSFDGYARPGGRGTGTRNVVVILATTSLTSGYARALEDRFKGRAAKHANIDAIVAVAHTEGGGRRQPNNMAVLLRTLAGFMVHPNVGAVLAVDCGTGAVTNGMLEQYLRDHDYAVDHVPHRFYSLHSDFDTALAEGEQIVRGWLPRVDAMERTPRPLSDLRIALQCGGSDAFSGISGNPLAGCVAKEAIRHGGAAVLAETDELIGAESYILANTRDAATAERFLGKIAQFKELVGWHGHSAEGNPSGGNKFRGLYNIAIKSIGAARKKDPEVCLDHVIDYAEPMREGGYYFMDSPGNDLESIAGQVAAGCNMIFFITGNGSITNFPFVPTIKFVTTTGRWNLLSKDMDVNAGRYQNGESMEDLARETFDYTVSVASGTPSVGERAGHSQVSIWRDWGQTDATRLEELRNRPKPGGEPITVPHAAKGRARFRAIPAERGSAADQVALVVPTSLCAGQIARRIVDDLNRRGVPAARNISRFVTLVHTEGCGASGGENEEHYTRSMIGYLVHPFVRRALLLEHGCERTHNDLFRHVLGEHGIDADRFGFASIQLDGGIEKVVDKVENWFLEHLPEAGPVGRRDAGVDALSLGLYSLGALPGPVAEALAAVATEIAGNGGTVVIPENASLRESPVFREAMAWREAPGVTLAYGETAARAGLHVMATPGDHVVEALTGLGATGVQVMLVHVDGPPIQGHPMIPVLQVASQAGAGAGFRKDLDAVLDPGTGAAGIRDALLELVCETASGTRRPRLWDIGNTDFQLTRGYLGVSL